MRVRVERVSSDQAQTTVEFSADAGSATADWEGETPLLHAEFDVEIEVPGRMAWGNEIHKLAGSLEAIQPGPNSVRIAGRILSIEDDSFSSWPSAILSC
jgi:hypothetical protein